MSLRAPRKAILLVVAGTAALGAAAVVGYRALARRGQAAPQAARPAPSPPPSPAAGAPAPPPSPAVAVAAPPPSSAAAVPAPPPAPRPAPGLLAGGRTVSWWRERLELLRRASDGGGRELFEETRRRAGANGLTVTLDGDALVVGAAEAAGRPPGARP